VKADHSEDGQRPDPVQAGRARVRLYGFAWFHRLAAAHRRRYGSMLTIAQPSSQQQRRTSGQDEPDKFLTRTLLY
jgi:hypothetical protein